MTRIKICGITNLEDALAAERFGADALGFIAVRESPRFLAPEAYREISRRLPPFIRRVVVARDIADAVEYLPECVQYFEQANAAPMAADSSIRRIRAVGIRTEDDLAALPALAEHGDAILLDTRHPDKLGGSGETFDWNLAVKARQLIETPIILAGGLNPDNVRAALETVRPYAVDVSTGTERAPGLKDHDKVRAFIQAVRDWDRGQADSGDLSNGGPG